MNIAKKIEQYDNNSVILCDPIKNNIMTEGNFIRILYSTPNFTLNGIYIDIRIKCNTIDKYYNKYNCSFDISKYKEII